MHSRTALLGALRQYWGYDSFRPLQERIVGSILADKDACVVMPTGGGKSLCYQLPAALLSKQTVIVISPLIALMQDQVASLTLMGIASALLNSFQTEKQQSEIIREAEAGKYRLLYLSPERLTRSDTLDWLRRVPISLFAIDEAHCISEWGHEFRPEYRQLNRLRHHFPDRPITAFTASATQRVRHDIIEQLKLRSPDKYIASFHRPNLRYIIKQCEGSGQPKLLVRALRHYAKTNVIVYAPTIKRVEDVVEFLKDEGIPAIAYHGKMDGKSRKKNQELWMADEVRVLVGTIAFGLGINKAAVRAVIHLSLPKSIEQYYQEAGRAGRDGHPADCVMLWQRRDAGLLAHFIGQLTDPREKDRAWDRYHEVRDFVESKTCRHRQICLHFGETPKWKSCGACDACGITLDWFSERVTAKGEKRRPSPAPVAAATRTAARKEAARTPDTDFDPTLFEYLREWRRSTAKHQGTAAFVVLHDTSLEDLCRKRPASLTELRRVSGFGDRKTELYGVRILSALAQFKKLALPTVAPVKKSPSVRKNSSSGWWGARPQ